RRVAGRAARVRERTLVDQDEVAPAAPREVVGEAVSDAPGARDDGAGARGQRGGISHAGDISPGWRLCSEEDVTDSLLERLDVLAHQSLRARPVAAHDRLEDGLVPPDRGADVGAG